MNVWEENGGILRIFQPPGLTSQNRQDGGWTPPATAGRVASDLVPSGKGHPGSGKGHPDAADGGATEPPLICCISGVGSVVTGVGQAGCCFFLWNFFWKCWLKSCKTPKSGVKPHFLNDRFANMCDKKGVCLTYLQAHSCWNQVRDYGEVGMEVVGGLKGGEYMWKSRFWMLVSWMIMESWICFIWSSDVF